MSIQRTAKSSAFGVEPGQPTYRLRQARYQAIGEDIARLAREHHARTGEKLALLDVGCADGISMRYAEVHPGSEHIAFHGVDRFPRPMKNTYKWEQWQLYEADLEVGMTQVDSDRFDVVVCEQVLEHLHQCDFAVSELIRVMKPGGLLIVGVPIFAFGAHLARKHLVPHFDRLVGLSYQRGHVQAFSKRTFVQLLEKSGKLNVEQVRGFRFISGGPLRPLEYCRWWWQLNRRLGAIAPSLCIEIQVLARKRAAENALPASVKRAA